MEFVEFQKKITTLEEEADVIDKRKMIDQEEEADSKRRFVHDVHKPCRCRQDLHRATAVQS